jgi:hypothetical protein
MKKRKLKNALLRWRLDDLRTQRKGWQGWHGRWALEGSVENDRAEIQKQKAHDEKA